MKLGWILSMLIPKCPQIIDLKTKTSLKDYVREERRLGEGRQVPRPAPVDQSLLRV